MKFRDVLLKSVSAVALVGAIVGSAPSLAQDSNPAAAAELGPIAGEIGFSWWGGQGRNQKTDDILKLFEAENPGVTVVREAADFNPHWEKLTIQSAAGNQPYHPDADPLAGDICQAQRADAAR